MSGLHVLRRVFPLDPGLTGLEIMLNFTVYVYRRKCTLGPTSIRCRYLDPLAEFCDMISIRHTAVLHSPTRHKILVNALTKALYIGSMYQEFTTAKSVEDEYERRMGLNLQ